jgi:phage baseplate assembly protein W
MAVNPTAFRDAEATNNSDRNAQVFSDLNLNFVAHPLTGDITKLTNIEAVKRSVRNLINTNFYERPFHPEIGSNVRAVLFEPVSPIVEDILSRHIRDVIENFEPRVELININSKANVDENAYNVTIEFFVQNSPSGVQTVNLFLERLR